MLFLNQDYVKCFKISYILVGDCLNYLQSEKAAKLFLKKSQHKQVSDFLIFTRFAL